MPHFIWILMMNTFWSIHVDLHVDILDLTSNGCFTLLVWVSWAQNCYPCWQPLVRFSQVTPNFFLKFYSKCVETHGFVEFGSFVSLRSLLFDLWFSPENGTFNIQNIWICKSIYTLKKFDCGKCLWSYT